jgi:hypothetical protein
MEKESKRENHSPGNIQKDDAVHLEILQFGRQILAVTLQRHIVGQIFPFANQQILATHLAVVHLVADP